MVSEEITFENVDDGRRMPSYTISSHMSLGIRCAKNSLIPSTFIFMRIRDRINYYLINILYLLCMLVHQIQKSSLPHIAQMMHHRINQFYNVDYNYTGSLNHSNHGHTLGIRKMRLVWIFSGPLGSMSLYLYVLNIQCGARGHGRCCTFQHLS